MGVPERVRLMWVTTPAAAYTAVVAVVCVRVCVCVCVCFSLEALMGRTDGGMATARDTHDSSTADGVPCCPTRHARRPVVTPGPEVSWLEGLPVPYRTVPTNCAG